MRLTRLAISNCSRIRDTSIEVRDHLVLIGPNGSGKSTVLLCLDMLLGMDDQRLRSAVSRDLVRDVSKPFCVEGAFGGLTSDELAVFAGAVDAQRNNERAAFHDTAVTPRNTERAASFGTGAVQCNGEHAGFAGAVDAPRNNELLIRLEVRVTGNDVDIKRYFPASGSGASLTDAQRGAFGWTLLRPEESPYYAKHGPKAIIDAVFAEIDSGADEDSIDDMVRKGANILAIDEPEAHLHPSSQRSLAKLLKLGACQKVLVTHSPTIAGSFQPDEIVVIRADGSATQPKAGFLRGDAGMVARWWVGKQLEPLTAGVVVAVEGPSDRVIVNRVAAVLGLDLDRYDVVVVETGGCGEMRVMESIFGKGGFDIPLFELVDEDNRLSIAKRLGADPADPADLERHHVFISTNDLEDEYVRAIGPKTLWERLVAVKAFSSRALRQCPVGPDGIPTAAALAEFIREKNKGRKIPAALVAASLLDAANAPKVESVTRLLMALASSK